MFWTIVGALVFVFFVLPVILAILSPLLGMLLTSKTFWKGLGYLALGVVGIIILSVIQSANNSHEYQQKAQHELNYKINYMQALRSNNPGQQGYIIVKENKDGTVEVVKNQSGGFTAYPNYNDCFQAKSQFTTRYYLNSWDYTCELL